MTDTDERTIFTVPEGHPDRRDWTATDGPTPPDDPAPADRARKRRATQAARTRPPTTWSRPRWPAEWDPDHPDNQGDDAADDYVDYPPVNPAVLPHRCHWVSGRTAKPGRRCRAAR